MSTAIIPDAWFTRDELDEALALLARASNALDNLSLKAGALVRQLEPCLGDKDHSPVVSFDQAGLIGTFVGWVDADIENLKAHLRGIRYARDLTIDGAGYYARLGERCPRCASALLGRCACDACGWDERPAGDGGLDG